MILRIFLFMVFMAFHLSAQSQALAVEEVIREMSRGMKPGVEITIPDVSYRGLESALSRYIRKGSRSKTLKESGELHAPGAVNPEISTEPFHIYVRHLEVPEGVRLTFFFSPDDSIFLSKTTHYEQGIAMEKFVLDFGTDQYAGSVEAELNTQERKLKSMEQDLESLVKEKQKAEKKIKQSERAIGANDRRIRANMRMDSLKAVEIIDQQEIAGRLNGTGSEEEKLAEKKLKGLQKEKRKMERAIEKMARANDQFRIDIENAIRLIEKNDGLRQDQEKKIEAQKDKVKEVRQRLRDIR